MHPSLVARLADFSNGLVKNGGLEISAGSLRVVVKYRVMVGRMFAKSRPKNVLTTHFVCRRPAEDAGLPITCHYSP
jgi:hypothetical protein